MKSDIRWYNEERNKTKLNGLSPVEYRLQTA
ncbi:IS3 family transposase [Facklamia miroungae]